MQGPFKPLTHDGRSIPRNQRANADRAAAQFNLESPPGIVFEQSAQLSRLVDNRFQIHLAIIQDSLFSGSDSGSNSGSGNDPEPSGSGVADVDDQPNAYEAIFAMWVVENGSWVAKEISNQPKVIAIEANGDPSVEAGTKVMLYPGPGQPDFYYFFAPAPALSGSGNTLTVICPDGTTHNVQVSNGPPDSGGVPTGGPPSGGTSGSPILDPPGGAVPPSSTGGS